MRGHRVVNVHLMAQQIFNKNISIDNLEIFYREAGDKKNPSLLLLHGFPTSSVMFKNMMIALSDKFHLIAPDYPGFGFSAFPSPREFEYSFQNISTVINKFIEAIGLNSFSIYLHDYGSPVGLNICVTHPQKIEKLIVQSGNAYEEGLGPEWNETRDYWAHPTEEKKKKVSAFLSEEGVKMQYTAGLSAELLKRVSPESWIIDWHRMNRPGNIEMQFQLNCDYQSHVRKYAQFQEYFRMHQPAALVLWGRHDAFFSVNEAACYKRDLPNAEVHILEGGHMALETNFPEVVDLIERFLSYP